MVEKVHGAFTKALNTVRNKMIEEKKVEKKEEKPVEGEFDLKGLLGKDEGEAVKTASEAGFKTRVLQRDSESFMATMDMNMKRINFHVEKGLITKVWKG